MALDSFTQCPRHAAGEEIAILMLKFLKLKSTFAWSLSTLAGLLLR